jgi:hypothetical protein
MSSEEQGAEGSGGGVEDETPARGSGLGGMEAAVRAGTTPSTAAGDTEAGAGERVGDEALEERAAELGDLASMQADPGEGLVDPEPGALTEKRGSAGAPTGTETLGLGTLDQGATAQVTGEEGPAAVEGEPPAR